MIDRDALEANAFDAATHVFPPALVPMLRDRSRFSRCSLADVADEVLTELLTVIFWAGLETYEGERNAVGVAFLGSNAADFVIPESPGSRAMPLYQWKVQRFHSPRPFTVGELVKLAVAGFDRRIYSAVSVQRGGTLAIAGLAREGFNVDADPFLKVVATRPGSLSIRSGRDLLLAYERGAILTGGDEVVFSAGPVLRGLEAAAHAAQLDGDVVDDYVRAVRSLVREMAAHGRGGILIVSPEERPAAAETATYRMALDSSLASLLRLARRVDRPDGQDVPTIAGDVAFGPLLRNAFLTEGERLTEEIGALTAIDGATLINCDLALIAFGVMLPLKRPAALAEALDVEGVERRAIDLGSRGTRHHAGATYAAEHPGSVVFVASEDGAVSCLLREAKEQHTLLWRLGPTETHRG
jgi:DisA bacterial checkpoint controller nucleotide-binding